jgi:hypothetical protein
MKMIFCSVALLLGALGTSAQAQYIVGTPVTTYYAPAAPVVAPAYAAPVVVARRPITAYYAPAAVAAPVVTSYYAPAAAPIAAPVTSYYAPAPVAAPVYSSYYAPAVTAPVYSSYYAPAPVVGAPVVTAPVVAARPVVLGRSIYGTRELYVPGQPVRNTLRAITP